MSNAHCPSTDSVTSELDLPFKRDVLTYMFSATLKECEL
jgi:hypothetical protein